MSIEWSLTIIALSSLILTISAAFFFWQARRTAKAIEAGLNTMNTRLPELLAKLEVILSSLLVSSQSIRSQVEALALALSRTKLLFDYLSNYEKVFLDHLARPLISFVSNAGAVRKGIIAFFAAISSQAKKSGQ